MSALIIDGRAIAEKLDRETSREAALLTSKGVQPRLAAVLVGHDPASEIYVRSKMVRAGRIGILADRIHLPESIDEAALVRVIEDLNLDTSTDGILVQLPLPAHIDQARVIAAIAPSKDVDGFAKENAGGLATNSGGFVPCTPLGCLHLIKSVEPRMSGLHAVVVGHSNIVGKPMAQLLLREQCTVTVAHKWTKNLPELCAQGDIVVVAVGRPELVRGAWLKPGSIVIDVGINRIEREGHQMIVGDVAFEEARQHVRAITPVPGGVGPMTIACLLQNTVEAASYRCSTEVV
jgi:methylenetetrahydrofolate dehydrogenase (NADP+)/methenyltetrahydrofolate cyclohydrolase